MGKAEKFLERMRNNLTDWRIEDLITIAQKKGATIRNPKGSHVIFTHDSTKLFACIPAHRPIESI